MRRLIFLSALALVLSSCQVRPHLAASPPLLETEGAVFVYLDALPQEVEGLSFIVSELYAERADGGRIPLSILLPKVDPQTTGRERLFARGVLPPGSYAGLSVRIREAFLTGEKGAAALKVPEEISGISIPFLVERRRAVVVSLSLNSRRSLREGFRFAPAFSGTIPRPGMLAVGRIGISTSGEGNAVTIFDKVSGKVISVIPTGESPWGVAVDSARRRAYVALSGEDAVEVIDLLEVRVLDRLRLAGGDAPRDLALTPDGETLLVANSGSNTVSVIDAAAFIEKERILVGTAPQSVLLDGTGRRAYVFNELSDSISVLDVPRAMVAATISTESGPVRGSLSRDGSRLYVLQRGSPYLGVVDTFALTMTRGAYIGNGASALKVDTRTGWLYLARRDSIDVEIFDPSVLLPMDSVPVGGEAAYLTIDGEEHNLWTVLPGSNQLLAVDLVNKKKTLAIDVGEGPHRVAVMGEK
jgi:YVTN family beta-propeller protein